MRPIVGPKPWPDQRYEGLIDVVLRILNELAARNQMPVRALLVGSILPSITQSLRERSTLPRLPPVSFIISRIEAVTVLPLEGKSQIAAWTCSTLPRVSALILSATVKPFPR